MTWKFYWGWIMCVFTYVSSFRKDMCYNRLSHVYFQPRVVGFFQFNSSPQPPGYITYLSSALQALKRGKKWSYEPIHRTFSGAQPFLWAGLIVTVTVAVSRLKIRTVQWWEKHIVNVCVFSPPPLCFSGADFRGVIRFGVVTNKQVAEAISVEDDETVYLYRRFNSSLVSNVRPQTTG